MYVAVKGGEAAIAAAHALLERVRRGNPEVPEITAEQIREQLTLAVDRVMCEGSLFDPDLAALAIKHARGDLIEAIFLVRAYRTTLPRLGYADPVDTAAMRIRRRVSATFKDLPGGQILGPTFDYTHRLLEDVPEPPHTETLRHAGAPSHPFKRSGVDPGADPPAALPTPPRVLGLLDAEGLIEANVPGSEGAPGDITREPMAFPASREVRLQALARGDEGFLLGLGYASQRGYGRTHPFAGEIRMGEVEVGFAPEEVGFCVPLGRIRLTECEMINQFKGSAATPPQFTRGYGLALGHSERKAMTIALVERALRAGELGEEVGSPTQDQEFVLSHADNVQATGFVEHLKLPHYVDFQAELALLRQLRAEWQATRAAPPGEAEGEDEHARPL
jgi:alpha-D-ribose 1-methylphosphonate 5-triphosphate synthase subunit PhnI